WCRFREFVCKDAKVPIAKIQPAQALESRLDNCPQDLFRRRVLIERSADRIEPGRAHRLPHYFRVKTCFVPEVIVDGGDIRARAAADLSYGGVMEPELREHFSGSVYQPLPCTIAGGPAL